MHCASSRSVCLLPDVNTTGLVVPFATDNYYDKPEAFSIYGIKYFGINMNKIDASLDGDLNLTSFFSSFCIRPYHHSNSNGAYFGVSLKSKDLLNESLKIRAAFAGQYGNFNAVYIFLWTWILWSQDGNSTFYQVALCTDNKLSFLIIDYKLLQIPSDSASYYTDLKLQPVYFNASTTGSNCGVPGQFIFQLNNSTSF
jgi:hypothetical protein